MKHTRAGKRLFLAAGLLWLAGCATVGNDYYLRGQELQAQGKADEAIADYYRALEQDPGRMEVRLKLAEALAAKGRKDAAVEVLEAAQAKDPGNAEVKKKLADAYFARGQEYQGQGKISDAYESWSKCLKLYPGHQAAAAQLAQLYSSPGEKVKPSLQAPASEKQQPQGQDSHQALGLAYFKQGKYPAAIAEFQEALRRNPQDAKLHNNLGSVYLQTDQLDEALASLKQAEELDPRLALAHNNCGTVYFKQGRYLLAREEWEQALSLDQENETIRRNLQTLASLGY